jgi:WD40 repeat protein
MTDSRGAPSDQTLLAYDQGLLSPAEIDAVTQWLESHPEGEERLRQLTERHTDVAIEALRQPCEIAHEFAELSDATTYLFDRLAAPTQPTTTASPTEPDRIRDYQLLQLLGGGGMGRVYRARHTRLQRDVAVKLLLGHLTYDPQFRGRFQREIALVGRLDHPNLIRAHDAGVEGDHLFLVMDLLDGKSLSALIAESGPLPLADACEVVRQAALGLHHAHEHGLVHRDVKPGNLFLTTTGVVKVIDLGLARSTQGPTTGSELTSVQAVMGTPECMAPEQWERAAVDRQADLYALGCVMFRLLTGRPLFADQGKDTWVALQDAHRFQQAPSLRDVCPDAPSPLVELASRLLTKDPQRRPATALEVAEALAPFTVGHNLPALLSAPTPRPRPAAVATKRRRRIPFKLAGVLLAAALLLGVGIWFLPWSSPPAKEASKDPPKDAPAPAAPVVLKPTRTLRQHTDGVTAVAFSPNGKILASGGRDRTILLWDTDTWEARGPLTGHSGEVIALAFSPDGKQLASVTSNDDECAIRLWDVATGKPTGCLGGRCQGQFGLAYSPDGKTLASGGYDKEVHFWDVTAGTELLVFRDVVPRHVRTLSFSPDGTLLATGGSGRTRLWDTKTGAEVPSQLPEGMCPLFVPNRKELAGWTFAAGRVTLCELPSGHVLTAWPAHSGFIEGLAVSSDGRFLASVGREGSARVWATDDQNEVATLKGHRGVVYAAAFSPDGKLLVTGGLDDLTIHIWKLPSICHVRR